MAKNVCNENVFKALFYKHAAAIRNFIYYKSGNLEQAEDLVQDAFGKLWENCSKVEESKAKSYLYTVANNAFLNQVAREKVVLKFTQKQPTSPSTETPHFLLEQEEFKERLAKAIGDLPEKQRIVFLLNRFDKMTYQEIAKHLNISVKAVEKRMHSALKVLKKIHHKV